MVYSKTLFLAMSMVMKAVQGKVVSIHYTLTDDLGMVLDSSQGREPFTYLHGYGNIVRGLETALEGASVGFASSVKVAPADGYGDYNPEAVFEVPRAQFPPNEDIQVGMHVQGEGEHGIMTFKVVDVNAERIVLDANHPMAGKNLNFDIEVLAIRDATPQELSHSHVHAHGHDH